jgi:hypothetical protein
VTLLANSVVGRDQIRLALGLGVMATVVLIVVAAWLLSDLWSATAPKPITDDFLKLLEDSFARDWRKPRT